MKNGRIAITVLLVILLSNMFSVGVFAEVTRDRYFSCYDPAKYNDPYNRWKTDLDHQTREYLQYRMNCYGYAFQFVRSGPVNYNYRQYPGSFVIAANRSSVKQNVIDDHPDITMSNVVFNMQLDASRIGYSITPYTVPSSGIVQQIGPGCRLIAVATGKYDYHFYMQHSDGTWSHKPGPDQVTNLSLEDNVPLTNENIVYKANQGYYKDGQLRFFITTKDAVTDYAHGEFDPATNEIPLYFTDLAGDCAATSTTIDTGTINACTDYQNDYDYFCFRPSVTGTYRFTTSCLTGADFDALLYDRDLNGLYNDNSTSPVDFTYTLTAGQNYFIRIMNWTDYIIPYTVSTPYTLTVQKI